uniref:Uncharacterized protein n=1 Tax=Panagrolaimus sp. PS1159 TaxID=55785 RepID=A0AC35FBC4_9BILA
MIFVHSLKSVSAFCADLRDHSAKCIVSIVGITILIVLLIAGILIMLLWLYDALTFKTLKYNHDEMCSFQPSNAISVENGHSDSDHHNPPTTTTSSTNSSDPPRMRRRRGRGNILIVDE